MRVSSVFTSTLLIAFAVGAPILTSAPNGGSLAVADPTAGDSLTLRSMIKRQEEDEGMVDFVDDVVGDVFPEPDAGEEQGEDADEGEEGEEFNGDGGDDSAEDDNADDGEGVEFEFDFGSDEDAADGEEADFGFEDFTGDDQGEQTADDGAQDMGGDVEETPEE